MPLRSTDPARLAVLRVLAAVLLAAVLLTADDGLAQAPRNPFGVGGAEGAVNAAPAGSISAYVLAKQAEFYRALASAVRAAKADGTAIWGLLGIGLAYGVFHAAGPGHGKAVIASYVVANERALGRGALIACAAAALQGIVAVVVVGLLGILLSTTARRIDQAVGVVEAAGFALMAAIGLWLVIGKTRALLQSLSGRTPPVGAAHGHFHMPGPEALRWTTGQTLAVIAAAGARPCSGAILLLVFALSQGIFMAGVAGVAAMSFGTALTTSAIAAVAVFAKLIAVRLASGRGRLGTIALRLLEIAAALIVLLLGLALLTGQIATIGA